MRAGRLRETVTFESASEAIDAYGEVDSSWSTYCTRRADVAPADGREFFNSGKFATDKVMRIRLRYDTTAAAITAKMRAVIDGVTYDVESVTNLENRNRELHVLARAQA